MLNRHRPLPPANRGPAGADGRAVAVVAPLAVSIIMDRLNPLILRALRGNCVQITEVYGTLQTMSLPLLESTRDSEP